MPTIGFHASHEQSSPRTLLADVQSAEQAGFATAMCSDHFMPWTDAQGHAGYAWSWLGAALQATSMPVGTITVPGYRYHPAIVAQKAATLAEMFPGRFWFAVGSGERLNEHVTGEAWPTKPERNARLRECADVIRALFAGETVEHRGRVIVEGAKLYTRAAVAPPMFGAAITEETARFVGEWADGLLTVQQPLPKLRKVVAAFRETAGDDKPMFIQLKVAYDTDEARARHDAYTQWKAVMFESDVLAELRMPKEFEAASKFVREDDVENSVMVSSDLAKHVDHVAQHAALGFSQLFVHCVNVAGDAQRRFIDAYGEHVLPAIARA